MKINHKFFFKLFCLTCLLIPVVATSAFAGRYELIKGKGVEVCEAYQKNLNSINHPYPMMCEREINPEMKDFRKPDWQNVDTDREESLVWEEYELARKSMGSKLDEQRRVGHREWMKERIRDNVLVLQEARIDIDNNGTMDTVLKQQDGDCPMHRAFSVSITVLTEDGKHYDLEKSKYINADFSKRAAKLAKDTKSESMKIAGFSRDEFWGFLLYDVFLYKGKSYFDLWEMGKNYPDPNASRLHVFIRKNGVTSEVCTYRFGKQKETSPRNPH